MINVLIVDDEPLALDILETYIEQMPDLRLIDRCESAREAQEVLNNEKVDLMFLDIQMQEVTGIEFLKSLDTWCLLIASNQYICRKALNKQLELMLRELIKIFS